MSTPIKDMLQDMRELRANLQHSLIDVPNYAIAQRCDELDAQIAAVEALQEDAMRYRGQRACALESDPTKAAQIDEIMTRVLLDVNKSDAPTVADYDGAIDSILSEVAAL